MVKWLPTYGLAACMCAVLLVTLAPPGAGAAPEESSRQRAWQADVEPTQEDNVAPVARDLLTRANDERVERGAQPLEVDADLEAFAVRHSRRMARDSRTKPTQQALSHSDDRGRRAAGGSAEIVATQEGSNAVAQTHVSAMRSDPHREILLAADAGRVGVGVACENDRVWVTYVSDGGRDRGVPEQPVVRDDAAELGCADRSQTDGPGQAPDRGQTEDPGQAPDRGQTDDPGQAPDRGQGDDPGQAPDRGQGDVRPSRPEEDAGGDPPVARDDADDGAVVERHESRQPDRPSRVDDLGATRLADSSFKLTWSAAAEGDGEPAGGYVVTQVREPGADKDATHSDLCDGVCRFPADAVGQRLSLTVGPLAPETTYRYRVRAVDDSGQHGPSDEAHERTTPPSLPGLCPGEHVQPAPFADHSAIAEPHRHNVDCLFFHQVGTGYDDGAYHPGRIVRRDHMATFLVDTLSAAGVDLPPADPQAFTDVAADSPHAEAINRLAAAGVVDGGPGDRSEGAYGPALGLRRDQLASFLVRALEYARDDSLEPEDARRFDDVSSTNPHADNIAVAAEHGLTPGVDTDTYRPEGTTRRDQLATFVVRLLRATEH